MKRSAAVVLFCSVLSVIFIPTAWGAGFLVFEQGTKAMGMAGAFTATADDPTAIWNNPAGITQLSGSNVSLGTTFIRNDQKYFVDSPSTPGLTYQEKMNQRTYMLPHLYVTQELNEKMTLGFGFNTPFGIGTDWKDDSIGNSVADEAHLKTYDFNPNLAMKLGDNLSVALGFHYTRAKVQIIRQVGAESFNAILAAATLPTETPVSSFERLGPSQLGRLKLDARGGGWAYNVGLLYRIPDIMNIGLSYRSDTKIEISRTENTVEWNPSGNNLFDPFIPINPIVRTRTNGKVKVGLPGIFLLGVSLTAIENMIIELDLQYTTWNHFNDLIVELKPGLNVITPLGPTTNDELDLQEDWENKWGIHLGIEHRYSDSFAVRAGYFFDNNPIPNRTLGPILPDSDRHNFSLGCGYTTGDWTIDAAYMWSNFENRHTRNNYQDFNASYKTNFHLFGMTLTRKL